MARPESNDVKGALLFAGGQMRFDNAAVWERFIDLADGKSARIAVIPAASQAPRETGQEVVEHFNRYGGRAEVVLIAPMLKGADFRAAAADPANGDKLRKADAIWFTGGDQRRITQALFAADGSQTPALKAIWEAYRQGAVVGGTSAGAAIMSRVMFAEALGPLETLKQGITKGKHVDTGLGFLPDDWFVDQHFLARGRFARALCAMRDYELKFGIGVDEDTAVVFRRGTFEVVGRTGALVMDLRDASHDPALPAFNLKKARLSYLDAGDRMDARTLNVTVSQGKAEGRRIDPKAKDFEPWATDASELFYADILANRAIYGAMVRSLSSKQGVVKGLAFSQAEGAARNDLGFEFRTYRGDDTIGWWSSSGGNGTYTVWNVYVDIAPIKLAQTLYEPIRVPKE
jgi:cyanophycinase